MFTKLCSLKLLIYTISSSSSFLFERERERQGEIIDYSLRHNITEENVAAAAIVQTFFLSIRDEILTFLSARLSVPESSRNIYFVETIAACTDAHLPTFLSIFCRLCVHNQYDPCCVVKGMSL